MFQRSNLSLVCCVLPANCYNLRSYWFQITDKPDTTAVNPWRRLERIKYWASENRSVSSAQVPRTRTAHTRARSANWGESPNAIRVGTQPGTIISEKSPNLFIISSVQYLACGYTAVSRRAVAISNPRERTGDGCIDRLCNTYMYLRERWEGNAVEIA